MERVGTHRALSSHEGKSFQKQRAFHPISHPGITSVSASHCSPPKFLTATAIEIGSCITTGEASRLGKFKRENAGTVVSPYLSAPTPPSSSHLLCSCNLQAFPSFPVFLLIPPLNLVLPLNIPFLDYTTSNHPSLFSNPLIPTPWALTFRLLRCEMRDATGLTGLDWLGWAGLAGSFSPRS